jgi:hypothetical protein
LQTKIVETTPLIHNVKKRKDWTWNLWSFILATAYEVFQWIDWIRIYKKG